MTQVRILIACAFIFFAMPLFASAFEVPYQKIAQQRGSSMTIDMYGEATSHYARCDLDRWVCDDVGTSTPELYPEFIEKNVVFSEDNTRALVAEGFGVATYYDLYVLGPTTTSKTRIDFSGEMKRFMFSGDDSKILFITPLNEFVIFDLRQHVATRSIPIKGSASFVRFSPHGNYIAYYSPNTIGDNERTYALIDVVHDVTYTWKEKNDYWDSLSEEEKIFDFSPDERHFLYLSDRNGVQTLYDTRLWLLDGINGRLGRRMFSSNFTVNTFLFDDKGVLYFTANRKNPLTWSLYSYVFSDQRIRTIADNVLYRPPPQRVGAYVVFLRSDGPAPVLYAFIPDTGSVRALPVKNESDLQLVIATGTIKQFTGGRYGVLYMPEGYDKTKTYPLIIWLHGGPNRQTSPAYHSYHSYGIYDAMLEQFRRNGFIVLKLDYRGSYGYGKQFAASLKGNVGKLDVKDVIDAVVSLKKEMHVGELYPMGVSYGGYLALRTVAEKPALFSGAVSVNGVTDWWTLIKNDPHSIFQVHFNGVPASKNKSLYDQASIFLRLNKFIGKQILLVEGDDDGTVPHKQTTMLHDALLDRGVAVELVSYEHEGHILSDSAVIDDLCDRVIKLPAGYGQKTCGKGL